MKNIIKNKKVLIISISILIVILLLGFSYAFFIYTNTQEGTNIGSSACFKLTMTESNDISLSSTVPLTESEASGLTPYTFTIKNICKEASSYDVTIEDLSSSSISLNTIRYKLNNESSNLLGSIIPNETKVLQNTRNSRTIKSGILLYNEEVTYNLKMWVDENANKEESANKTFSSKVVIVSSLNKEPYYTITINNENGEESYTKQIVKGRSIGIIDEPTKEGYTFLGWYDLNDNEITSSSIPTSNLNIHASYSINQYTISYDNNDGSSLTQDIQNYNTEITLPNPSRQGYTFLGWYDSSTDGNKIGDANSSYTITQDIIIYAHWQANTYTISYNFNGSKNYFNATNTTMSSFSNKQNEVLHFGNFALSNFTLNDTVTLKTTLNYTSLTASTNKYMTIQMYGNITSWSSVAYGIGTITPALIGTGSRTFEFSTTLNNSACFTNERYTYQLRADYYTGGTITLTNTTVTKTTTTTQQKTYGTTLGDLPTVSDSGYTFLGWYTAASGGTRVYSTTPVPAANTTYYAHWS